MKLVETYNKKKAELQGIESQIDTLQKNRRAGEHALKEASKVLFNSSLDEVSLLHKVWSARKVNEAQATIENAVTGWQPNHCNIINYESDLDELRLRVDVALSGLYPNEKVEAARAATERLREAVKTTELSLKKIDLEMEYLSAQLPALKTELTELDRRVCMEAFEAAKVDVLKIAWPLIRKAVIALNSHNPYYLRWPDMRIFGLLLDSKLPIAELLKERDKMRREMFGESGR